MDFPESMQADLGEWNDGRGIDLKAWIGCEGWWALAIGFATFFWPEFESVESYILRKGVPLQNLRGFEEQPGATRQSIEWVVNHVHLFDLHAWPDASADKFLVLGTILEDIHRAKLAWQFPDRLCEVEFYVPDNREDLLEYQLSFWQTDSDTMSVRQS